MINGITRRKWFFACFSLALLSLVKGLPREKGRKKDLPNFIIILADDMGYGDPGCFVKSSKIPTRNINKLAGDGMLFSDAHTPSAVCTPTRYGLLTGRFAWRTRLKKGVLGPFSRPLIERGRLTIALMLKRLGYVTACFGKWHLGMGWQRTGTKKKKIDFTKPLLGGPLTAGFDTYFGTDVPNYPPYCFIEDDHILGPVPDIRKPRSVYGVPGPMQKGWDQHRILPELKRRSLEFIEKNRNKNFFLYIPLTAPHTPIVPNKEFLGKSKAGDYGDFCVEVDDFVGAVVDKVDSLGLKNRTMIIFTSDNGSPARAGNLCTRGKKWAALGAVTRLFGHNPNAPWRGMKADTFEGGHRVPFIVRWPGVVKPGTRNDNLVGLIDVFATIAEIVGFRIPRNAAEDSISLYPTLLDPKKKIRDFLVLHSINGSFAVRWNRWKVIFAPGSGGWSFPRPREARRMKLPKVQVYDLSKDGSEKINLYREHPEIVGKARRYLEDCRKKGYSSSRPGKK